MEYNKIETLLEKYFDGQTNIADEKELTNYFLSSNVAPHLEQYKSLFEYFTESKKEKFVENKPIKSKKRKWAKLAFAASLTFLIGVGSITYFSNKQPKTNHNLGTYDNPEIAFAQTQKALELLSKNVNVGVQTVSYINEFEQSKNLIFKQ